MPYYRRILRHMIDVGDGLLGMVEEEATAHQAANPATSPPEHVSVAYERITRSMRRTILLAQRLDEPTRKPSSRQRIDARKRIIRDVEDVIQRKAPEDQQEPLHAELLERLDRPELDDEIADRSITEIVTDICRDFGIAALPGSHPWKRRIPHDIAILNARAAQLHGQAPSAELATLLATAPKRPPPVTGIYPPMTPAEEVEFILEAVRRDHQLSGG